MIIKPLYFSVNKLILFSSQTLFILWDTLRYVYKNYIIKDINQKFSIKGENCFNKLLKVLLQRLQSLQKGVIYCFCKKLKCLKPIKNNGFKHK